MLPQFQALKAEKNFLPVMVLASAGTRRFANICQEQGVRSLDLSRDKTLSFDPIARTDDQFRSLINRLPKSTQNFFNRDQVAHGFIFGIWRYFSVVQAYKKQQECWKKVLKAHRPRILVVPGDRELGFIPPLLAAAEYLKIPTVISGYNIPTVDSVAASRAGKPRFRVGGIFPSLLNYWAAWRHPEQLLSSNFGQMLFSPGWLICALSTLGMLSARPWTQGGGRSSYLLIDGARKRKKFVDLGVHDEKLCIVGDLALDRLYRAYKDRTRRRQMLCSRYSLTENNLLYVVAVPIYAEHNLLPWEVHLRLLREFLGQLASRTKNVVLSFHPKSSLVPYEDLIIDLQLKVCDLPLEEILPNADLFVCGNSSTVDWAILCRVPVINLDYAAIQDRAFCDCDGVKNVSSPEMFSSAMDWCERNLVGLIESQDRYAKEQSTFDGECRSRLLTLFHSVVKTGTKPRDVVVDGS